MHLLLAKSLKCLAAVIMLTVMAFDSNTKTEKPYPAKWSNQHQVFCIKSCRSRDLTPIDQLSPIFQ